MQKQKSQPEKPDCGGVENDGTAIPRVPVSNPCRYAGAQQDCPGQQPLAAQPREIRTATSVHLTEEPPMAGVVPVQKLIAGATA